MLLPPPLQGTLRVLLVLLHDFPEFLCEYHFQLCDVVPPSCIQMRNLILSAFPRNMRLPDPFTPNLKVRGAGLAAAVRLGKACCFAWFTAWGGPARPTHACSSLAGAAVR